MAKKIDYRRMMAVHAVNGMERWIEDKWNWIHEERIMKEQAVEMLNEMLPGDRKTNTGSLTGYTGKLRKMGRIDNRMWPSPRSVSCNNIDKEDVERLDAGFALLITFCRDSKGDSTDEEAWERQWTDFADLLEQAIFPPEKGVSDAQKEKNE